MLRVFSDKIIVYMSPTRMISDCVFSAICTMWEHSSRWARIESISAVDNHPYHFLAHPTLPAVSDIHATFATLARCFRCSPYFRNLRISSHYVAHRANPSRILPIMSIRFTGALISISFHISYCICTDGLASWPITSQFPLIPNSSHHLPHGFGLCSLALLSITFRFLDVPIALATFSAVLAILYRSFHT